MSAEEWAELPISFFDRPVQDVAPDLVGKIIWRAGIGGGRLTEVEAYMAEGDPASHSFRGKTERNSSMFGPPGRVYVYLSYGMHVLLNVVCEGTSVGSAILIRSFEPMGDVTRLRANRSLPATSRDEARLLSCGPGRVGQALALTLDLDGLAVGRESGVFVYDDGLRPSVSRSPRIGIRKGVDLQLRFYATDSECVARLAGRTRGGT